MAGSYYSIIIPVFNEADRLPGNMAAIKSFVNGLTHPWELVFVNDGSQDTTVDFLQSQQSDLPHTLVNLETNCGKGWAVRSGMLAAGGQYRAFLDADLASPPAELLKLFEQLEQGVDVAIGSRIQADGTDLRLVGRKPQPWIRRFLGKVFRLVATRPFLGRIRDSQCGAKAFTASAAEQLFSQQKIKRWTFDIEILFLARRAKLNVIEVPVQWEAKDNSKLKPSVTLAFEIVRELVQIAWIHRRGQ